MTNLPKQFVLQLGSLITLYVSVAAFITLIFSTINIAMPDAAAGSYEWASSQTAMRTCLAILAVFFPAYLYLTRKVNVARRIGDGGYAGMFTKWLVYLSLLVGGGAMLVDLVFVVNTFLEGELTTRFLLKASSLLIVIGLVSYYYLLDAKGHWNSREQESMMYGAVATAVVIGMMAASLYHLESPSIAREKRIDEQQIMALQEMQYRVEAHMSNTKTLPASIDELYLSELVPKAPEGRASYQYKITGDTTYELCATFANATDPRETTAMYYPGDKNYNWDHKVGEWCFAREAAKPLQELIKE
jgi:hypothetical protein